MMIRGKKKSKRVNLKERQSLRFVETGLEWITITSPKRKVKKTIPKK